MPPPPGPAWPATGQTANARATETAGRRSHVMRRIASPSLLRRKLPTAFDSIVHDTRPHLTEHVECSTSSDPANWRSEGDSNPRGELTPPTAFPVRRPRPARRSLRGRLYRRPVAATPAAARRGRGYTPARRGVRVV